MAPGALGGSRRGSRRTKTHDSEISQEAEGKAKSTGEKEIGFSEEGVALRLFLRERNRLDRLFAYMKEAEA